MRQYSSSVVAAAAAFALVLFSCSKEEKDAPNEEVTTPEEVVTPANLVSVTVSIPEEGLTRVSFTPDVDGDSKPILKLAWEASDAITVNGKNFAIDPTSISNDGKTATFNGEDPGSGPYTIVYGSLPGTPNEQTQASDGDTGHLGYYASLAGVDEYRSIEFNSSWAASHGGTFTQSGVLLIRAKLPTAAIADAVKKVIIRTSDNVLNGSNSLAVTLTAPGVAGDGQVLSVYAVLSEASTLTADTELLFDFQVDASKAYKKYTAYRKLTAAKNLELGKLNNFTINAGHIDQYAGLSDAGTAAAPYLIADQHQMNAIHGKLAPTKKYYKMVDDIDMTGISWAPLATAGTELIDFDGNNHTLDKISVPLTSYSSIFGLLTGRVTNLTIDHATITPGAQRTGVLASYIGTGSGAGEVSNITITNSKVGYDSNHKGTKHSGILAAFTNNAATVISDITISNCDVYSDNSTEGYTGGMIGIANAKTTISGTNLVENTRVTGKYAGSIIGYAKAQVIVSGCTVSGGMVTALSVNSGGFVGQSDNSASSFTDCHVDGTTVGGSFNYIGGFVGLGAGTYLRCSANATVSGSHQTGGFAGKNSAAMTINQCYTAGSVAGGNNVGGFIGWAQFSLTMNNCYSTANVGTSGSRAGNRVGGLIGHYTKDSNTSAGPCSVSNCFAAGDIYSANPVGGLVGQFAEIDGTLQKCIAWNANVNTSSAQATAAAVIGNSHQNATLTDNYRKSDMNVSTTWSKDWTTFNHANASSSVALIGSDGSALTTKGPYFGKVDASKTIFQIADALGWDGTIWNLSSGSYPTLKANPEL